MHDCHEQTIAVTVEAANADPMPVGSIDAVTVRAGATSDAITLGDYFSDADMDDMLSYDAVVQRRHAVATAMITKDDSDPGAPVYMLTITGVARKARPPSR